MATQTQERQRAATHAAHLAWRDKWLAMHSSKTIIARYDGKCAACGKRIGRGTRVIWRFNDGVIHESAWACQEAAA